MVKNELRQPHKQEWARRTEKGRVLHHLGGKEQKLHGDSRREAKTLARKQFWHATAGEFSYL